MEDIEKDGKNENLLPLPEMARRLDELQASQNDGRGVSCVQAMVSFLEIDDLESARRTAMWDHDKIVSYPKVMEFVRDEVFKGEDEHPWSALERMQSSSE